MKQEKRQGILFIIGAGFFFALMTFFVRLSGDLPTMEKAFFRNAVAAVVAAFLPGKRAILCTKEKLGRTLHAKLLRNGRINL